MPGQGCRCAPRTKNLEEEKPFTARTVEFIRQLRKIRQVAPLECRHRIVDEQGAGLFYSKLFADKFECGSQLQLPATRVMSIAGHQVDQSAGHPAPGILLRSRTKHSCERTSSNLQGATQPHPFRKPFCLQTQDGVALRMGYHRPQTQKLNLMQRLVHRGRNREFVELNEKVVALVYAEPGRILAQRVQIFAV